MSRKADYVIGRDKLPIVGLSQNRSDGRYYATHSKPRKWFGKNSDHALIKFREWQDQQNGSKVKIYTSDVTASQQAEADSFLQFMRAAVGCPTKDEKTGKTRPITWEELNECAHKMATHRSFVEVGTDRYWASVRENILADTHLASQKTALPLNRLHSFKEPGPSVTLKDIGESYLNKQPPLGERTKKEFTPLWDQFRKLIGKTTVGSLTAEDFRNYRDKVYALGKGLSHRYANNRFGLVTAVFNHALKEGEDTQNLQTALGFCKMLRRLKGKELNPRPISREDYEKLLLATYPEKKTKRKDNPKWRAILLTALNCAMYPNDICALRRTDIDLEKGVLVNRRTKNGVPRIAVLWSRTLIALKEYWATMPPTAQPAFLSDTGTAHVSKGLIKGFLRVRKAAGIEPPFDSLRDGSQTAAIENGADPIHVDMLMGHRASGVRDNYMMRRPQMVADACAAIEAYYFSPKTGDDQVKA